MYVILAALLFAAPCDSLKSLSLPPGNCPSSRRPASRLICAYPQVAVYRGSGAQDDPANFVCKVPKP